MTRYLALVFVFLAAAIAADAQAPLADATPRPGINRIVSSLAVRPTVSRSKFENVCPQGTGNFANRVLADYGAIFTATADVVRPPKCIFANESDVTAFHSSIKTSTAVIGGAVIELQEAAMRSLLDAIAEASARRIRITPFDGSVAGRRSYADTIRLWNSRFLPALQHWTRVGKISRLDAENARSLNIADQVEKVLIWEAQGMMFGTGRQRSIFYSTAPPGSSQHLAMLAFDVAQYNNLTVRDILNKHGWYQTVPTDKPHFTYLGKGTEPLFERGLRPYRDGNFEFWILNL